MARKELQLKAIPRVVQKVARMTVTASGEDAVQSILVRFSGSLTS